MADLGLYVYGLVANGELPSPPARLGIDDVHPVECLSHGGVCALVSRVDLDQFDEQSLHERLSDMDWVARIARGHQRVLDAVLDRTTPIPMRLCTLYSDEDGLRQLLEAEQQELAEVLGELRGKLEWGVQAFAEPRPAEVQTSRPSAGQATAQSGTAYLHPRLAARRAGEREDADLSATCDRLHEQLANLAVATRIGLPQRPEASGREAAMILNAFYLIANDVREHFRARVSELGAELAAGGIDLELTGPWPPYNFIPAAVGGGR